MHAPNLPSPRGFSGHLVACAVGAGIDNVFRTAINVALSAIAVATIADAQLAEQQAQRYVLWTMLLFNLPFILCAPTAGSLGDRLPKHLLIRGARIADLGCVALGVAGLWLRQPYLLFAAMAGFATVSAFFAPVKLAVVPELVPHKRLASANGWLAGLTVLSILFGTALAAAGDQDLLRLATGAAKDADLHGLAVTMIGVVGLVLCAIGITGAWSIPRLTAQDPGAAILPPWAIGRQLAALHAAPGAPGRWSPALGLAAFWSLGALAATGIPLIAAFIYHYTEAGPVAGLMIALALGMITGAVWAPKLMNEAHPAGLPIIGALVAGLALAGAGLHAANGGSYQGFAVWLFLSGVGAGWWEVPLTVLLQERAEAHERNQVMSAATILASIGSVGITLITMGLTDGWFGFTLSSTGIFIGVGLASATLAVAIGIIHRIQVGSWLVYAVVRAIWNLNVTGLEHVPKTGGCLLICNHLSYADGLALFAHLPRRGRFLIYRAFTQMPVIGPIVRIAGAIPVAAEDKRRALLASIDAAIAAAKAGEVVLIFPEGKLTRSGTMDSFRSGMERIAKGAGVPIIPCHLSGLYGTWMSRATVKDWPTLRRRVEVRIGAPLPPTTSAGEARAAVSILDHQAAADRAARCPDTLGAATLRLARRHPRALAVRDPQGSLPLWQALAIARALLPHLGLTPGERRVGILLPPGRAGTLVNLALALDGRTAVNLNHTAGPVQVARMCALAQVQTVISAGLYLRKIGDPEIPGRMVKVEELLPVVGKGAILTAAIINWLVPPRWLDPAKPDDVAALVFSSGSTGDPKGVQLTHRQILANCRSVVEALDLKPFTDVLLTALPLFHSFGLVPAMWLPLTKGLTIAATPDPNDGPAIGKMAAEAKATFTISTPTFVRGWMRRIEPEQFASLRLAVVGAERCPAELKVQFKAKYNAELLEGYGGTELAPTVALNLPTIQRDKETEVRSKEGSVGRPLPGLAAFTVDPATRERLPLGTEGMLIIRSPSRMLGYLDRDDLTAGVFHDGGYVTGDMGRVDDEGFVFITGRLARFAKIGGEMVPLDNVERLLQEKAGDACEIAVAAVADPTRGERLIVLHTGWTGDWETLFAALDGSPALWRPKSKDCKQVAEIPRLGTGKRDLAGIKRLATE